jgi:hypothetical protein
MQLADMLRDFVNLYNANPDPLFPVVISLAIMTGALLVAIFFKSRLLGSFLVIIFALVAYSFASVGTQDSYTYEFFINLSTDLLGAIVTLIMFSSLILARSWTFPVIWLVIMAGAVALSLHPDILVNQTFALNITTTFIGAFIFNTLTEQWVQTKTERVTRLDDAIEENIPAYEKRIFNQLKHSADIEITVFGTEKADLENCLFYYLDKHSQLLYSGQPYPARHGDNRLCQTFLAQFPRDFTPDEVALTLRGTDKAVKKTFAQIAEILEIINVYRVKTTPSLTMPYHLQVQVKSPDYFYSQILVERLQEFVERWDNTGLEAAADDLREWIAALKTHD